jgi:hypothetical protein
MAYCEREAIFYHHVLPYMNTHDMTTNIYNLSKNKQIYNKWYSIILERSSKQLNKRTEMLVSVDDIALMKDYIQDKDDLLDVLNDYTETLLDTFIPSRNYGIRHKNMMKVKKHIIPYEITFNMDHLSHRDTNYERRSDEVKGNIRICAIYRMTNVQKIRHLRKCPNAKALIY